MRLLRLALRTIFTALVLSLIVLVPVNAQTNPWTLTFTASPDHATVAHGANVVERYELVVTPQGGQARPALDLGKPSPTNNTIALNINSFVLGLPAGTYTAVVRAVGPGGAGASLASDPFALTVPAPGAPGKAGVSKSGGSE